MAIYTLDMFTGAGMLGTGIELAFGPIFKPIAYVECEAYAAHVLATAMEEGRLDPAPVWSDARTVCGPQFRHYVRQAAPGGVGTIVGGYPCPDFSVAGKRAGVRGVKGALWWNLAEAIATYEPELLFLENVGGHTSQGFDTVCSTLRQMGYRIAAGLFTASETGASHKRERLFILADRSVVRRQGKRPQRRNQVHADRNDTPLADRELAGAAGFGVQGMRTRGIQKPQAHARQELPKCGCSLPLFPPGPGDLDAWRNVLAIDPSFEPAICRMADGMANRTQRLRLCGNGVVPLEAAYAFATLGACLWGGAIK